MSLLSGITFRRENVEVKVKSFSLVKLLWHHLFCIENQSKKKGRMV